AAVVVGVVLILWRLHGLARRAQKADATEAAEASHATNTAEAREATPPAPAAESPAAATPELPFALVLEFGITGAEAARDVAAKIVGQVNRLGTTVAEDDVDT